MKNSEYKAMLVSEQKVQFYDCDPMGVVWHGNYLRYMEVARTELLGKIGCDLSSIREGDGVDLPLIESGMKYLRPLHAGDDFHVVLLIRECEVRLAFDYFIGKGDALCCLGSTVQCAVSRKTGELEFAMPEHFAECIRRASESEELRVRPWGCFNGRMARRRA